MKPGNEIPLDGIELSDAPGGSPADDMGIPLAADDSASAPDVAGAYGIDLDSRDAPSSDISHDNSYDRARRAPTGRRLPPVLRAIATIYQRNASGTLNVGDGETTKLSMFIKDGRILNVAHPDLSSDSIGALLLDSGLVTRRRLQKAITQSRAAGTTLDYYLATTRIVSAVTIHHLVDGWCAELVLAAMNDNDAKVSFSRVQHEGLRKNCQIPLPWLLKEFRRRETEAPVIAMTIPDPSVSFVRTSQLESEPIDELWEEIDLGAAEKQVYFYVDGARTVDDLAMATGQSRFAVMRAVAGMIKSGDIVATLEPARRANRRHALRSSGRAASMVVVLLALLAVTGAAVLRGHVADLSEIVELRSSAWGDLFQTSAKQRVSGAVLSYLLITEDDEPAPDELLERRLILPGDVQTAVSIYRTNPAEKENEPEQVVDTVGP